MTDFWRHLYYAMYDGPTKMQFLIFFCKLSSETELESNPFCPGKDNGNAACVDIVVCMNTVSFVIFIWNPQIYFENF